MELIRSSVKAGKPLQGWQVDKAARKVVEKAGYGKYFFPPDWPQYWYVSSRQWRQYGWPGDTG